MSFLRDLKDPAPSVNPYESLHYLKNPFPPRGKVMPSVYVERPELVDLQRALVSFLREEEEPNGAFWAVEGERGVGKSNFLQHLDLELRSTNYGTAELTAHRYIASQAVAPRFLVQEFLQAIGSDRFEGLISEGVKIDDGIAGTDLGRFFAAASGDARRSTEHAEFLMRWLGGHQTYQKERDEYGIWTREKLYPAISFPYLRTVTQMLVEAGLLLRIVLLLDEFEDVQVLGPSAQTEYVQALKGLVNSFNWSHLFVILAGQQGVFARIGEQYTSLPSRWTTVTLAPLTTAQDAVDLAFAYKKSARRDYKERHSFEANEKLPFEPTKTEVEAAYARLITSSKRSVRQRDLLNALHEWIEARVGALSVP